MLANTKTRYRLSVNIETTLIIALTKTEPQFNLLGSKTKNQQEEFAPIKLINSGILQMFLVVCY